MEIDINMVSNCSLHPVYFQQIGASVYSGNFRVHDVLIWDHFDFNMWCVPQQRKLTINTDEANIYMCDLKEYTDKANIWKTHQALNIHQKVNFVLEHNISSTSETRRDASWTPICWVADYNLSQLTRGRIKAWRGCIIRCRNWRGSVFLICPLRIFLTL